MAESLQDQELTCRDCNKGFPDSIDDQTHRLRKGWTHSPTRCPPCKKKYLEELSNNPKPCADFKQGDRKYGDNCRFSHATVAVHLAPASRADKTSFHIAAQSYSDNPDYDSDGSDDIDPDCY